MNRLPAPSLLAFLLTVGCSSSPTTSAPPVADARPAQDSGNQVLQIEPNPAVVHLVDGLEATQRFSVYIQYADGTRRNVSADASLELGSSALGALEGDLFTASGPIGGRVTLTARLGEYFGLGEIQISETFIREGVDTEELSRFPIKEATAIAPAILHPETGSIIPQNLNGVEVVFRTETHSSFELRFFGPSLELREYFRCRPTDGPCFHSIQSDIWNRISAGARAGSEISYQLRGLGAEGRNAIGATEVRTFEVSEEPIVGGIYYWDGGAGDILRYEFGLDLPQAEVYLDGVPGSPDTCVGCHSLSRDGSRMSVVTSDSFATRVGFATLDVSTRSVEVEYPRRPGTLGNYWALSPNGDRLATVTAEGLVLRDPVDETIRQTHAVPPGAMAAFSPDGDSIAYSRSFDGDTSGNPQRALGLLQRDSSDAWSHLRDLVRPDAETGSIYAPDWSPEGSWIAAIRSTRTDSRYQAPAGQVLLVNTTTGEEIRAEDLGNGTENFPRWDPSPYVHRGESLYWLVYSSRRPLQTTVRMAYPSQLWLVAFQPSRLEDGSPMVSRPLHLPFQDWNRDSLMGRLVTEVARQPCDDDLECPGTERCIDGVCRPTVD